MLREEDKAYQGIIPHANRD